MKTSIETDITMAIYSRIYIFTCAWTPVSMPQQLCHNNIVLLIWPTRGLAVAPNPFATEAYAFDSVAIRISEEPTITLTDKTWKINNRPLPVAVSCTCNIAKRGERRVSSATTRNTWNWVACWNERLCVFVFVYVWVPYKHLYVNAFVRLSFALINVALPATTPLHCTALHYSLHAALWHATDNATNPNWSELLHLRSLFTRCTHQGATAVRATKPPTACVTTLQ